MTKSAPVTASTTPAPEVVSRLSVGPLPQALTFAVVAVARWMFSGERRVPHVAPDEPSQLAIARFLAGRRLWNMFDHATWQPGLGTLLSPVYRFTTNGETVMRWGLGLNAVIGGLGAVLLLALTRRLTGLSGSTCAVIAIVVGIAPASLSASAFVWAEALVSCLFLATVLMLIRFAERDRFSTGVAALACAVAGYSCHSRLLPLVATTILVVVGLELWRRRWARAMALAVASTMLVVMSLAWTRFIIAEVWDDPTEQNTVGAVWDRLAHPIEIAESLVGQIWYQLAATLGLAGLGTVVVLGALRGRSRDRVDALGARIVVVSLTPLIGLSAVFMSDRGRSDQYIYGRYNDAVVWPVVALGLAWVVCRARTGFARRDWATLATVVAAVVVSGAAVEALRGDDIRDSFGVRAMIAGVLMYVDGENVLDVRRASVIALLLLGLIVVAVLASRLPDARVGVVTVGVVLAAIAYGAAAARTKDVSDVRLNGWQSASSIRAIEPLLPTGATVGIHPVPTSQDPAVDWVPQRQRFELYQMYLPERLFLRDRGLDDDVGPYVLAPIGDPTLTDAGAVLLWEDPNIKIGLWREPSGPGAATG